MTVYDIDRVCQLMLRDIVSSSELLDLDYSLDVFGVSAIVMTMVVGVHCWVV